MSNLLLDDKPLIVMPSLAKVIGLQESIFLQQLHYWLERSSNIADGHKWVYNTVKEWQEQFPFWSESTIRRLVSKLEKTELIITGRFNKLSIDQTKWYRINYIKLDELSSSAPISRNRETSSQSEQLECSDCTTGLVNMNRPLPEITTESTTDIKDVDNNTHAKDNPFTFFEQNGFGMIGGFMHENITSWCDDLSDELVLEAMKLATENGAKTWKYVEAILRNWSDKNIQTVEQAQADQLSFKEQQSKRKNQYRRSGPTRQEPIPEWFEKRDAEKDEGKKNEATDVSDEEAEALQRSMREKYGQEP